MAGTNLLTLIDDIASMLDDVALMTKAAAKKTAGVLGDDLALNAQQVVGVRAARELPVVMAVAIGSLKNKLILVPAALVISILAPWMIMPLLMLGGAFLCFEGFEKLFHRFTHGKSNKHSLPEDADTTPLGDGDLSDPIERKKVRGAIRTDFILSAEIVVITLGTVATATLGTKIMVLTGIALLMTVGVYGLVAGIVKLDDGGLYLSRKRGQGIIARSLRVLGFFVIRATPKMMQGLSIAGTVAMFLVGGNIVIHGIPGASNVVEEIIHGITITPGLDRPLGALLPLAFEGLFGLLTGAVTLVFLTNIRRLRG